MPTLLDELTLQVRIIKRAAALIIRRDKRVRLQYFAYKADTETNDTVIVRFDFKNAICYSINGKKTMHKRHVLVRGLRPKEVSLSVQGLLTKKDYIINLRHDAVFITEANTIVPITSNI